MFANLPDSPQGIGDIVGLAARHVRANFKEIFRFLIVPTVFATASATAAQWAFSSGLSNVVQGKAPVTSDVGSLVALWLGGTVVLSLSFWVLSLRLFALVRLLLGFSPTLKDAEDNLFRKKFRFLAVCFLCLIMAIGLFSIFGFAAFLITTFTGRGASAMSVIAVLVFLIGAALVSVVYSLTLNIGLCILACEEDSAVNIVGRSLSLTFRHFWRAVAFGLIFAVTFTLISYPMTLPAVLVAAGDGFMHGLAVSKGKVASGSYQPPLWSLVFAETWTSLAWLYLRPFACFAFGLFYFDLRLRTEGLDIGRKLELALPRHPVAPEQ